MLTLGLAMFFGCIQGQIARYETQNLIIELSPERRLRQVMRNEFSRVINTNANGVIGNYVGFSTNDNNIAFAYSWLRDMSVLEVNASGTSKEGISTFVTNSSFNTDVSLGGKFHRIIGAEKITISNLSDKIFLKKVDDLNYQESSYKATFLKREKDLKQKIEEKETQKKGLEKRLGLLLARQDYDILDLEKAEELKRRKEILVAEIQLFEAKTSNASDLVKQRILALQAVARKQHTSVIEKQFNLDSLSILAMPQLWEDTLASKRKELKIVDASIQGNKFNVDSLKAIKESLMAIDLDIQQAQKDVAYLDYELAEKTNMWTSERGAILEKLNSLRAEEIKLKWFSLGLTVTNQSFTLLDTMLATSNVYQEKDLVPTLSASFTWYRNEFNEETRSSGGRNIEFITFGGDIKYGNNLNELKQVEVRTTDSLSPNQVVISTENVYQGQYEEDIATGSLFADYYRFVGTENNVGIHLRGTVNLGPFNPVYSIRGGIILAAIKRDDIKSILQFEVFYGLNDIFRTGAEDNLLSRNILGLQTTFPFDFKFRAL